MIKKILSIIILVFMISSCDQLLSFFVSPVFNIPVFRAAWTVDVPINNRIIGDTDYFFSYDSDPEWQVNWDGTNFLQFYNYDNGNYDYIPSLDGLPLELLEYDKVDSPLFYLSLLFKDDVGMVGTDIITGSAIVTQTVSLNSDGGGDIMANYSMNSTAISVGSYILPEPAYLGIDGNDVKTELTGGLNILDIIITADHDFVSGNAICVFSNTNPAGLLYMVYYHDSGLVSLLYAHDVETTATGDYFPDGHYEYIWSVYRK